METLENPSEIVNSSIPKTYPEWKERVAKDRQNMTKAVTELAQNLGVVCEKHDILSGPHAIALVLQGPRGLRVTVEFDRDSVQHDVHVLAWHIDSDHDTKLSPAFGDVNPYHFRKSTQVAYGFNELMQNLQRGFQAANSGSAFQ